MGRLTLWASTVVDKINQRRVERWVTFAPQPTIYDLLDALVHERPKVDERLFPKPETMVDDAKLVRLVLAHPTRTLSLSKAEAFGPDLYDRIDRMVEEIHYGEEVAA